MERTSEWGPAVQAACGQLGLSAVSIADHRLLISRSAAVGARLDTNRQVMCTFHVQEESRKQAQSLILKPKREQSQFATVAEGVVSRPAQSCSCHGYVHCCCKPTFTV